MGRLVAVPDSPHRSIPLTRSCGRWLDYYDAGARRPLSGPGEPAPQVLDRPVGAGLAEFLDAVVAGGDADHLDAGAVAGVDVARGVADGDRRRRREGAAGDQLAASRARFGQLGAVGASRSRSRRR